MTLDSSIPGSRRALLAAGLGALGASLATALERPRRAAAVDGETMLVGGEYVSTSTTRLTNTSNVQVVFSAISADSVALVGTSGSGFGVDGGSTSSNGVRGTSAAGNGVYGYGGTGSGVFGESNSGIKAATVGWANANSTGVQGFSGSGPVPAAPARTGVYGYASQDASARGVWGRTTVGRGVYGVATTGTGVHGSATDPAGYALKTSGRLSFSKVSGVALIGAGATASSAIATNTDITPGSYVLLTPQADPGTRRFWATLDSGANTLTIRTNTTSASAIKVAWLLVG